MKQIKKFSTITKEGFSIKNLERFYGPEWGEDAAFRADILYNGQKIANIYQPGDGGCADARFDRSLTQDQITEIKEKLISFLKRFDFMYQEKTGYEHLKKKTAKDVSDDQFEDLVTSIEISEDNFKSAKKLLKKTKTDMVACITYVDSKGFISDRLQSLSSPLQNDEERANFKKYTCEQLNVPDYQVTIHYITDCEFNII